MFEFENSIRDRDKVLVNATSAEHVLDTLDQEVARSEDVSALDLRKARVVEREIEHKPITAMRAICVAADNDLPIPTEVTRWLARAIKAYLDSAERDASCASLDVFLGLTKRQKKGKNAYRAINTYLASQRDDRAMRLMKLMTGNIFDWKVLPASYLVFELIPGFDKPERIKDIWYDQGNKRERPTEITVKDPALKTRYQSMIDKMLCSSYISTKHRKKLLLQRQEIEAWNEESYRESEDEYFLINRKKPNN